MAIAMAICCASTAAGAGAGALPEKLDQQQQQRSTMKVRRKRRIAGIDQEVLVDPWLLADEQSRFAEYNEGLHVHYKVAKPPEGVASSRNPPAVLLHGFGASVFSWERILSPMAQVLAAPALAFDRPGFGLTSRIFSSAGNPYSMEFSAALTLAFVDFLQADQAILIGHSAGCIVAAEAYLKDPKRVAAIIMLAPAIVAPLMIARAENDDQKEQQQNQEGSTWSFFKKISAAIWKQLLRVLKVLHLLREALVALYCKIITAALRSSAAIWLIQQVMDRFGAQVVKSAWYNPLNADEDVIRGYTKPLGCRNWERALLEYVISLVRSRRTGLKLGQRLGEIKCPVLVITGDSDRLVPAWNARRLAKCFPNSKFHEIQRCGHLPHEEKPNEVLKLIHSFMDSLGTVSPMGGYAPA